MNKINRLRSRYINLTMITTFVQLLLGVFVVALYWFNIDIPNKRLITILLTGLILSAVLFNLLASRALAYKHEFASRYLQCFFVIAQILTLVYLTGGINSPWYIVLLMLIIGCSVLGFGAFFINIGIMAIFYVAIIVSTLTSSTATAFSFNTFPATLSALLFAALVAVTVDQYCNSSEDINEMIATELAGTKLTEKIMLGAIADPIIGVDAYRKIILINESAQSLSGWDMNDALNMTFGQVIKLKDQDDLYVTDANDPFLKALQGHTPIKTDQFYIVNKDSIRIDLSLSIAPTTNAQGQISGAIAVLNNISHQKIVDRERSEFISTASHEMRNPLASIEGYISIALNPNLATIDEKARIALLKAHLAVVHLGKLSQDLLSVSKIEDSEVIDSRTTFNISDLVLRVSADMERIAIAKGLGLFTHIGGASQTSQKVIAPAYMVKADMERITEVVTNLIDNAIKYTSEGDIDISINGDKTTVTIAIQDSGIGISAQDQKHLFEKFYRVNNSLTHEQPGTGLGLYITRNLVELYGGKIWVESVPGRGSTFTFRLPLNLNVA